MLRDRAEPKPLIWRGTSKSDFMDFPSAAQREMGYALFLAQMGKRHSAMAKTLEGFGGGAVVEVKENTAKADIERVRKRLNDPIAEMEKRK
ncbi:MAG: hypothetical protein A3G73_05845 [Rhodospirillales bacterium RIFCSPLOWO2_12_FULL_67_15]|nr:MAG: hypothetical protein A3G73_05845 [Rhodospirillales bacterium RIFCSPLOWO2_12_FULL_67_15]